MAQEPQIAVVGVTGVVGREVLAALQARGLEPGRISAFASERSEGGEVEFADETLEVEKTTPDSFRGMGAVILATPPDVSRSLASAAQAAGAWVVDLSDAFATSADVPLIHPRVNLDEARGPIRGRVVRVPSPVTSALVTLLEPLRAQPGVVRTVITALMGSSTAGVSGVATLEEQTASLLSGRETESARFPHRLAFNVIPQVGDLSGASSSEESRWQMETARLWRAAGRAPAIHGTAVQVPTFYGHALALDIELSGAMSEDALRERWRSSTDVKVLDAPGERVYPMPMLVTADPAVHVGRIRCLSDAPQRVLAFAAIDNAGRGAAINAVEIVEALLARR